MLMMILATVSCQLGSAGNGGRYRSACLSCRPGLRATWRHFCILRTTQNVAYYVFYHKIFMCVLFCVHWWWRSGWDDVEGCGFVLLKFQIKTYTCCIAYLHFVFVYYHLLLLAWAARSLSVKDYEEDDIFVMFCWILSFFYSVCFAIALLHVLYDPNVAIPSLSSEYECCLLTSVGAKEIGLQGSSPGRKCAVTVRIPELLFAPFFRCKELGKELGRGILAEELWDRRPLRGWLGGDVVQKWTKRWSRAYSRYFAHFLSHLCETRTF